MRIIKPPPAAVVLIFAAFELVAALNSEWRILPAAGITPWNIVAAFTLAGVACVILILAVKQFVRADTSVNPMQFDGTQQLVVKGIYRVSRNPMYLGFFILLSALACWLNNWLSSFIAWLFIPYLNHWQIKAEETFLLSRFGSAYRQYTERVRRWL